MRSLLTFASQASVGLKNALLIEQAARRMKELDVLSTVSAKLAAADDSEEFYREALILVSEASGSDIGLFSIFDKDLRITHHGPSAVSADVAGESTAIDSALVELADWVREYGGPAQVPSASSTPGDIAAIAAPIRQGANDATGAIALARVSPGSEFDEDDRRFLETIANLFAARQRH
jgi:hypothetical protein